MRISSFHTYRLINLVLCIVAFSTSLMAQDNNGRDSSARIVDSLPVYSADTILRIKNLNPFFNLPVDSTLNYKLEINRDPESFYWYLRNSPVGLRINKDNGMLTFKADKSFFLSGKLKYDAEYRVNVGVQNLNNPRDRIDTFFTVVFYNTDIIASKIKPSVSSTLLVDEGDTIAFKIQCENGSFPVDNITFYANTPLKSYSPVKHCDDDFIWTVPFDFVKETDSARVKVLLLSFVGSNRFMIRDTSTVRIVVRDALNYPLALQEYNQTASLVNSYVLRMKYTFIQLDKGVKKVKGTRTTFDITSSTTALTGSILASSTNTGTQNVGKVMPSVGVTLVPVKEAVAPQKVFDQNQAQTLRGSIKRLEFMVNENRLVGERDPDITKKTNKLKDELKQMQTQLLDVPLDMTMGSEDENKLNEYFNSPKVQKKYRLKRK